jgi:hypothetical protein
MIYCGKAMQREEIDNNLWTKIETHSAMTVLYAILLCYKKKKWLL